MSVKYEVGTFTQMMSTELNALASGSGVTQNTGTNAAFDNQAAGNLYFWGSFELDVTFGTAPTDNSTVDLYIVPALDETNFTPTTDGASPVVDLNSYAGSFNVRANTAAQKPKIQGVPLPPCKFKLYAINKTQQQFPATGSTLSFLPYREQ
jgi:hypothetical protein